MTADVIDLDAHRHDDAGEGYITGTMRCMECGHQWDDALPAGTTLAQCPECMTVKAAWLTSVLANAESWVCENCENIFFTLTRHEICCARCGTAQTGMWDE